MKPILRYPLVISIFLSFLGFAFGVFFGEKIIPGGPFVSFRGDIMPQVFAASAIFFALWHYHSYSWRKRIAALLVAGIALLVSILIGYSTYAFFHDRFARGDFFRW